jgi:hypothetical protein
VPDLQPDGGKCSCLSAVVQRGQYMPGCLDTSELPGSQVAYAM